MQKILFAASALFTACSAVQISHALEKQRSQLGWRQEATNKFTWNQTQKLEWTVVNAFIDVQTSPDGDIYAIQKIGSDVGSTKYMVYHYDIQSNVWNLTDKDFQAKAVRFDRLGNIYYLSPNDCVLNKDKVELVCGLSDFEVTVSNEIIGLHNGTNSLSSDQLSDAYHTIPGNAKYSYKALTGYKGLTLIKDQPIFIQDDGTVDVQYGSEKLESISAGIDGSLWALQQSNSKDHQLLKWQTVTQKWYKVDGAQGTCLSAYNEISVAIVDSIGLLSLSSQVGQQNEAQYVQGSVGTLKAFPQSNILSNDDFDWLLTALSPVTFTEFEKCYDSETLTEDSDTLDIQCAGKNHLIFVQTSKNADGSIGSIGAYVKDGDTLFLDPTQKSSEKDTEIISDEESSAILGFFSRRVIKSYQGLKPFYGGRGNQYDQEHLSLTYTHTGNSASDDLYFDIDVLDNSFVSVEVSSPDYEAFKTLLDYSSEQNTDFAVYPQSSKLEVFSGKV